MLGPKTYQPGRQMASLMSNKKTPSHTETRDRATTEPRSVRTWEGLRRERDYSQIPFDHRRAAANGVW